MIKVNKDKWIETDIGSVADEINDKILNPAEFLFIASCI